MGQQITSRRFSLFPYVFPLAYFGDAWKHTFSKGKSSSDFGNQCFVDSKWPLVKIFMSSRKLGQ